MSLRYALLALLTSRPMTGYETSKQFGASVGFVWHAPDSQIYPELRRMEKEGLIEARELPSGKKRTKREYRITEAGVRQFRQWINTPLEYQRGRDVHHLKAAYLEWADPEAAKEQLRQHIAFHTAQVEQWLDMRERLLDRTNTTLSKRLANSPPERHDRIVAFKVFAYEGLIERSRTEITWARRGLELIDELAENDGSTAAPPPG